VKATSFFMRDPLLIPLAALVAGIMAGRVLEFSRGESLWPIAVFAALALLSKRPVLRWILATLAMFFAGAFTVAWHRPGAPLVIDAGPRELVTLEGCVVEPSAIGAEREQFTIELAPNARARVSMALGENVAALKLPYGQRVEVEARVRPPRNFQNPGAFDYAGYLSRQKIYWTASIPASLARNGGAVRRLQDGCGSKFQQALFAIRGAALDRLASLYQGDPYSTGMMDAILIGDTARLEKIWTENFRRTGTFHALVISGTHVAVLAGVLLFLLRLCALPEMMALTATASAAWLYALVSGFTPPVARAAGGFSLYLFARFFFRRGRVLNLLAAVAIVFLLWDPSELSDASFLLSFLSVAAIGALAAPLIEKTFGPRTSGLRELGETSIDPHVEPAVAQFRIEVRLAAETVREITRIPLSWCQAALVWPLRLLFFGLEIAVISAVIQIGLALPMAQLFHRVSFTGLSANLMIAPILEAVVPLGFAAIFTNWHWVAALAAGLLKIAARTADWHARLEPNWRISNPPAWLALALVLSLLLFAVVFEKRWLRWPAGFAVAASFGLLLWQPWPAHVVAGELELTTIDVGQGDSLLLLFPQGKRVVIDSGGVLEYGRVKRKPNLDMGEDVVSPYLWNRGIRKLDVLVATHAHADHVGGALALLDNFHPEELWVGSNPPEELVAQATARGVRVLELRATVPFEYSGAQVEVLSPPEDYAAAKTGNNDSLAFRIAYGSTSFLLTGDMESPMEYRLLADGRLSHADVLKVGHHGSKTSTTQPFLDAVSPSIALISSGYANSFGHPHPSVIERLTEKHIAILRTDEDGLSTVRSDGKQIHFEPFSWRDHSDRAAAFNWAMAEEGPP